MARQMYLRDVEVDILANRVFISRTIRVFTIGDLSEAWKLSISSIYRYDSPTYREASRKGNRGAYVPATINCHKCDEPIKDHARCKDCTILIHKGRRCDGCNDRLTLDILDSYRELAPCV